MGIFSVVTSFFDSSKRVLLVSRKPNWKEYSVMAKITAIGIIFIAIIGYLLSLLMKVFGLGM